MQTELVRLEADWLHALQTGDSNTLDGLLDSAFVSSQWNAPDQLLLRDAYLREADRVQFRGYELTPVYLEIMGNFAIFNSRYACEYEVNGTKWAIDVATTDIWVHREDGWKALNRDASGKLNSKGA
jgi:hypothetical protein